MFTILMDLFKYLNTKFSYYDGNMRDRQSNMYVQALSASVSYR